MMTLYACVITNRTEAVVTLASAMRIAQVLGLDSIGPEQTDMPSWEDLAFPCGPSALKRQLCLRVWRSLNYIDAVSSFPKGKSLRKLSCKVSCLPDAIRVVLLMLMYFVRLSGAYS